jgi:hypothetical protein
LHVKHFRLSAVLGAWEAEQNLLSHTVTNLQRPAGVWWSASHGMRTKDKLQVRSYSSGTPEVKRSLRALLPRPPAQRVVRAGQGQWLFVAKALLRRTRC